MYIPTYIINLKYRNDRFESIINEFEERNEFKLTIYTAVENPIGSVGLWQSILNIIDIAKKDKLNYVLIVEDDHLFTKEYCKDKFYSQLEVAMKNEADVLLGGLSWFDYSVLISSNLHWVNKFTGTQFIVIFKNFYDQILNYDFKNDIDTIDLMISQCSNRIFALFPLISIQKDTGYSDVTKKNNSVGIINTLFKKVQLRIQAFTKVQNHLLLTNFHYQNANFNELQIPTYIINIDERKDRLEHITKQFLNKREFALEIYTVQKEKECTIGLWNNIKNIISIAKERDEDIIIICEDDHLFSKNYTKEILFDSIFQGAELGADIILGGISNTNQAIVVSSELCWVESFQCTQFTILFKSIFEIVLSENFTENDAADLKLSMITANKYVIHPFISTQKDFGYSDIPIKGVKTQQYQNWFDMCNNKLDKIRDIYNLFIK
ncbi:MULTISPECIES: hypothetical protein [unclassified Sphingobacterium]|uniref:hypothetical protein n=1 Tax=unclassified Sphingobacterium TaxID=2609468 RepID=UPI0010444E9E|nr:MULTISPECIES: hypothetical protein [unclassified Sphingobacterium]MCS3556081.1 GR25 family glycosyltransferase involved in LPS biosynthesis [Sphingobacterium sp. JUb21]TCR08458.1 hypothetical protein EDF66_1035 [Sphingobacterium sp. JUb20]